MKRTQRRLHLVLWLVLAPAMAVCIWLALALRPPAPVNDSLPVAETQERG